MEKYVNIIVEKIELWTEEFVGMLPNLALAVVVLLVFVLLAKILKKYILRLMNLAFNNPAINRLAASVTYIAIIGAGAFIALDILDLDKAVTSLLAGAGIIGLALGFAFQDIASNFMSGIILAIRKPFSIGQLIKANDVFGTVDRINLRSTTIHLPTGQVATIPNRLVLSNVILNYSERKKRRVDLEVGVSYGEDLQRVKDITLNAISKHPAKLEKEKTELYFHTFGDSSINFVLRFWVKDVSQAAYLSAQHEAILAIKLAFDKEGISIPFPIRTLDFGIKGGMSLKDMNSGPSKLE